MLYLFVLLSIFLPGRAPVVAGPAIGPKGIRIVEEGSSQHGGRTCARRGGYYDRAEQHSNNEGGFVAGREANSSSDSIATSPFSYATDLGTVSCDTAFGFSTHKVKMQPQSILRDTISRSILDDSASRCQQLGGEAYSYSSDPRYAQMAFDTTKAYIEQCPHSRDIGDAFNQATAALSGLGNYGQPRADYYAWLKSVLYLNTTDPEYFCSDVRNIAEELPPVLTDTLPGAASRGTNRLLAVYWWLMQNTTCDTPQLSQRFYSDRESQYNNWLDDSTGGVHYPYDTTLPPLDSIDPTLDTLLARHFLYASVPENYVGILSNASAYPNPTGSGTVISFGISQEAYVKIEVFDVLGNLVSSAGFESLFEPGNKAVPISLAGLPSGTYFARIETAYGEAQTVKVVKQ